MPKRIKGIVNTTTAAAVDDYLAFDGSTNGTRKILASYLVLSNGTYANPSWITALAGSKITGNIDGVAIGATSASTGKFSTLDVSGVATFSSNVGVGRTSSLYAKLIAEVGAGAAYPTLGTGSGHFAVSNGTYGVLHGVRTDGKGWIQVQRTDGTATAYDLVLQPSGGNVTVGGALTVTSTLSVTSTISTSASDMILAPSTGVAKMSSGTAYLPQFILVNTASDTSNPYFILQKNRSGAAIAVNDRLGSFLWQGYDSGATNRNAVELWSRGIAVGSGYVQGQLRVDTMDGAGATANRLSLDSSTFTVNPATAMNNSLSIYGSTIQYWISLSGTVGSAATSYGILNQGIVSSNVTSAFNAFHVAMQTQAASFTLGNFRQYYATNVTLGSGSAITYLYGFVCNDLTAGSSNNIGFYGLVSAGTGKYNLYMTGTAANYLAGATSLGSTLDVTSLTTLSGGATISGTTKAHAFGQIDPALYSAVGDGTADDTTALSNAIAAAGNNGVVVLRPGKNYKTTSQITVAYSNLTIIGYGARITSATDSQYQKFKFTGSGCRILGVTFNCLYTSATTGLSGGVVEVIGVNDCVVQDCTFNDVAQCGVRVIGNCARTKILGNTFYKNFCAIFSDDDTTYQPTYTVVRGNQIYTGIGAYNTAYSGAIKFSGVGNANSHAGHVIEGNLIVNPGEMGIELQGYCNDSTVGSNTITGAGFGISFSVLYRSTAVGNTVKQCVSYGIEHASGCYGCSATGNIIIGTNTSGTRVTPIGYSLSGCSGSQVTGGSVTGCDTGAYIQNSGFSTAKTTVTGVGFSNCNEAVRIKGSNDWTIGQCEFDLDSAYDAICLDTSSGAISRGKVCGNRFVGAPSNCVFQHYVPGTNAIQYVTYSDNDTTGVTAPAAGMFNESAGSGSLAYMNYIRCFNNTGVLAGDSFSTTINVYQWSNTGFSMPYRYWTLEGGQIKVDATSGNKTLQLPSAVNMAGWTVTIYKSDSSGNTVTISTSNSETINGASTKVLSAQWQRLTVQSNGANWVIVQSN